MSPGPARRGPTLPYVLVAGVEPLPKGWLVVTGRLLGATLVLADAIVFPKFIDVLDARPSFQVITLHAPVGLTEVDEPGGRAADRAARALLGFPRRASIISPPSRATLKEATGGDLENPSPRAIKRFAKTHKGVSANRIKRVLEVDLAVQAYWQRTIYECNPELSFYELNHSKPLRYGKNTPEGIAERRTLITGRMSGAEALLERSISGVRRYQLYDACADLWSARRIAGRAIASLPEHPEWDEQGRRMELAR